MDIDFGPSQPFAASQGYVPPGPSSAGRLPTPFYPFGKDSYEGGCRPYEPQSEIARLSHRVTQLERRLDALSALLTVGAAGSDGSSGAAASPAYTPLPPMAEQPRRDIDYGSLILAQRQHHQQSHAYDVIN